MTIEGPELGPGTVVNQRPAGGLEWRFDGRRLGSIRFERIRDGWDWLTFRDCTFESCNWEPLHLRSTDLVGNRFVGVVRGLSLWGRDDSRTRPNEIRGIDFTEADMQGLGLNSEVPVDDQLWPLGENYIRLERKPDRMQSLRRRLECHGDTLGLLG